MGLPEIFISFQTAAVSAITRSARGVLAVAVKTPPRAARQRPRTKVWRRCRRTSSPLRTTVC